MTDTTPQTNNEAPEQPNIRTMETDIAEYIKKKKPSLLSIRTEQVLKDQSRPPAPPMETSPRRLPLIISIVFVVLVAGGGITWLLLRGQNTPVVALIQPVPASLNPDETKEITIEPTRQSFLEAWKTIRTTEQAENRVARLLLRVHDESGTTPPLSTDQFFTFSELPVLAGIVTGEATAQPQFFLSGHPFGTRMSVMFEAKNSARSLQYLYNRESSLQKDFQTILFGTTFPPKFEAFADRTYRNIDYRVLALDAERDRAIVYLYFPARRLIIISTSEQSIHLIIDRLFLNR